MRTFSLTVMSGNRLLSCGTKQMPRRRIWSARSPASDSPLNVDLAAARRQQPADHAQEGRFAGAVRPDDAVAAILLDPQRQAGQDVGPGTVARGDVLDLEERHQATPR